VKRRLLHAGLAVLAAVILLAGIGMGLFMYRLSSGPVSLSFMKGTIETILSASTGRLNLTIGDAIIERDQKTGTPHFRLRNIELRDDQGLVIARAPRAAISVSTGSLFSGNIRPTGLELIGPRIMMRRKVDGTLALGFGQLTDEPVPAVAEPMDPNATAIAVQDFLNGRLLGNASALETVLVSDASVQLYDERNQAVWYAPGANLAFKRVNYGFAFFASANMAGKTKSWKTEIVANYLTATKTIAVEARLMDLVPAELSDKIFALSKLAQVRVPLSGIARFALDGNGVLTQAGAEFTAGAGELGFPDYVAEPVAVEGGNIKLAYNAANGDIDLLDSELSIGGTQATLTGKIQQLRNPDGLLNALRIDFSAFNTGEQTIDGFSGVELQGTAWTDTGRFDLDNLVLMAGSAQVQIKGQFSEGAESPGVKLEGTLVDLPAWMLKRLWPPVIAPNSRNWFAANVTEGTITKGSVRIDVPPDALADATKRRIPLADNMIDARFAVEKVSTRYFAALPPVTGAMGEGRLQGNRLELMLADGTVTLPSGKKLQLARATMAATNLAKPGTPALFDITATGPADGALELLDHPPLKLASAGGVKPSDASGDVSANVKIAVPLMRGLPPGSAKIAAKAKLTNAGLKAAFNGISIEGGDVDMTLAETGALKAEGFVKLNGAPAKVTWTREPGAKGLERVSLDGEFTDAHRAKLGVNTSAFLQGPIKVKLSAENPRAGLRNVLVRLDLGRAALKFDIIRWSRSATPKTKAEFEIDMADPAKVRIRNLVVSGGGMSVKGNLAIAGGGLVEAKLPNAVLDENNRMSITVGKQDNGLKVDIRGTTFDARPMINSMFQRRVTPPGDVPIPVAVTAEFDRVIANRGESFANVSANVRTLGSFIQLVEIGGEMSNRTRLVLKVQPNDQGYRELTMEGTDAGSALRAANLYSKIAGGKLEFFAELGNSNDTAIRRGQLTIRNFEVRNEAAIAEIDPKGRVLSKARKKDRQAFDRLTMPFSADDEFVRIGDSLMRGPDIGASVTGTIRKADGRLDMGGTVIPAYGLNSAIGQVPILGQVLVGGKGQGIFGVTFGLRGTMAKPKMVINPVSALAPGFLRGIFSMGGDGVNPDGTPEK
jgi:hypothetical protein